MTCRRLAGPGLEAARTSRIGRTSTRPPPTVLMRHLMKEIVHASYHSYQRLAALIVKRFAALVVKRFAALVVKRFAAIAVKRFAALVMLSTAIVADVVMSRMREFIANFGEPPIGTYEGQGTGHLGGGGMSGGTSGGGSSGDGCQSPPKGQHHH